MSTKETFALEEEERVDEEEGREVKVVGATFVISICGRFITSCAAILQINSLLMAPMTRKRRKGGMVTCMCVRMHVITEGKMSLSSVAVS